MNVGMIGLGKLGYPVALAMSAQGHDVCGYDVDEKKHRLRSYIENGRAYLDRIDFTDLPTLIVKSDIIFVAVQTPHRKRYEGVTPVPVEPKNFDYTYLKKAIKNIIKHLPESGDPPLLAIISTVLPGTTREIINKYVKKSMPVVYNPSFIAMGTVIEDFIRPEFVLMGSDDKDAIRKLARFYAQTVPVSVRKTEMGIEEAELTKVLYNTYIGQKITFANAVMEIAYKLGNVNCDTITNTLSYAYKRLMSPKYLKGGMGDGGGCHPRDNIAMMWLAEELRLSHSPFHQIMWAREKQAQWLANIIIAKAQKTKVPIAVLGRSFKPEVKDTTGSAAVLVENLIKARGYDVIDAETFPLDGPHVIYIGTNKPEFITQKFPPGSIVFDPWRMIPNQDEVAVIRIGERRW